MSEGIDLEQLQRMQQKLYRALKDKAVLTERSKRLAEQLEELKGREDQNDHVVNELLERQREMSYMLHLANSFVHRIQEANTALSTEFTELVKELPAPDNPDWEERVKKINDLFKKTGEMADELSDEVFKRPIGKPHTPVDPANIAAEEASEDEPEPVSAVAECETETEPDPEPEIIEVIPEPVVPQEETVVSAGIPEEEQPVSTVEYTDGAQDDRREQIDRLFGTQDTDADNDSVPDTEKPKAGVFARIRSRLSGTRKNAEPVDSSDEDTDSAAAEVDLPQENVEGSVDEAVAIDLDEWSHGQNDDAENAASTEGKESFISRFRKNTSDNPHQRTITEMEREHARRAKQRNRHPHSPN